MTPENFCYWLQGYFEVHDMDSESRKDLNADQVTTIREHLGYVFGAKPNVNTPSFFVKYNEPPRSCGVTVRGINDVPRAI